MFFLLLNFFNALCFKLMEILTQNLLEEKKKVFL